jgi:hypothetical protein
MCVGGWVGVSGCGWVWVHVCSHILCLLRTCGQVFALFCELCAYLDANFGIYAKMFGPRRSVRGLALLLARERREGGVRKRRIRAPGNRWASCGPGHRGPFTLTPAPRESGRYQEGPGAFWRVAFFPHTHWSCLTISCTHVVSHGRATYTCSPLHVPPPLHGCRNPHSCTAH